MSTVQKAEEDKNGCFHSEHSDNSKDDAVKAYVGC
jgi:hypothetical protein